MVSRRPRALASRRDHKQYVGVKAFRLRAGPALVVAVLVFTAASLGGCFFDDAPSESGDRGVEGGESPMLDFDGIDGLRVGKTTSDAANGGMSLVQDGDRFDDCVVMTVQSLPGVSTIVVDDRIEIVELTGSARTVRGVGPGSTKADVRSAHDGQRVQERLNRFSFVEVAVAQSEEDDPLTLSYVLDERGELVTRVRTGRASSLQAYDEGCA
jgi:hypothetical protein